MRRAVSPPIPTLRTGSGVAATRAPAAAAEQPRPRPPSSARQPPPAESEPVQSVSQRPVSRSRARADQRSAAPEAAPAAPPPADVGSSTQTLMNQLANLRKRLESEQQKVDSQIKHNQEQFSKLRDAAQQRKVQMKKQAGAVEVFERVRKHESPSRPTAEPGAGGMLDKARALAEFNALKYHKLHEGTAKRELLHNFPEPPLDTQALDAQQRALIHEQERELAAMKQALGAAGPVPSVSGRAGSPSQTSMISMASMASFNVDAVAARNEERLRRLALAANQQLSSDNPDDILRDFLDRSPPRSLMAPIRENTGDRSLVADTTFRPGTHSSSMA